MNEDKTIERKRIIELLKEKLLEIIDVMEGNTKKLEEIKKELSKNIKEGK
jgi:ribose 5-phosphate isomerase RpiB